MKMLKVVSAITLAFVGTAAFAQERATMAERGKASDSVRPIDESDIMYKTTIWRRMDLQETQNQPFFSRNNEITRYVIEGFKAGVLKAYSNDSLSRELTPEQFSKNLMMEGAGGGMSEEEKAAGFSDAAAGGDDGWGDAPKTAADPNAQAAAAPAPTNAAYELFPTDLTVMEIKEDYVFDKRRSRQYYDIQAVTVYLPAAKTTTGFDKIIASFKYKDLDKYFRSNPTKFIWYNNSNIAKHLNMADAFDLRLFSARILKQSNAKDSYLSDIYNGEKEGLVKAQQLEHRMMEWEHNLWEY